MLPLLLLDLCLATVTAASKAAAVLGLADVYGYMAKACGSLYVYLRGRGPIRNSRGLRRKREIGTCKEALAN